MLRLSKSRFEKFRGVISQDEPSMHALNIFIETENTHALFALQSGSESVTFLIEVSAL
jgi:hypothetical protein